ncbi:MAG: HlyD family type I secretion periplasmic adaptor subunit [Methyloligella sp.]|nr:MAG: HlyD family type I secretion periplasmic adaptor subunit [Methyloligella sp.]
MSIKDLPQNTPDQEIKKYQRLGLFFLLLLLGGIGGWAAFASLQGAVIASAQITVKSNLKRVQHLEGGIVSEILVKDGDKVEAGQTVLRLDTTKDLANLASLDANLNEQLARKARLSAERDKKQTITFPEMLVKKAENSAEIAKILKGQTNLLKARQASISGQTSQLKQRTEQLNEAIKGITAQVASKKSQLTFIRKELTDLQSLQDKGLVPQNRILALQREEARLQGEAGELVASTARTKVQISETEIQILQVEKDHLSSILTELRETTTQANQLTEQRTALADKLKRMTIIAPKSGIIHQLAVHTIGGVVAPGDPVLMIVPQNSELIFAARVNPQDIDQVFKGQKANVHLSAFDQRTTPEVTGIVTLVSAETTQDQPNTPPYYKVHVELPKDQMARIKNIELVPGMNAEVFIQTKSRLVFEYLLQPLTDQIRRTMREP